jgi:hypothetical protein
MNIEYVRSKPLRLRDAGKDEKWLHDLINQDPSILGLGDVTVFHSEKTQPTGGRIDLILGDPEEDLRYEVEIMLGAVDESHIIRTIEYWDVERRRYPGYEHRAVIIAEEITNRFFNVIGLLNKAVPIIAIQINAFTIESKLSLNFVKVLDVTEETEEEPGEQVDRKYWESRASKKSLEIMDRIISLIPQDAGEIRVKYNRGHVAVGTTGTNFCWLHPRKGSHIHLHISPGAEAREAIIRKFEDQGVEAGLHRSDAIMKLILSPKEVEAKEGLIREALTVAEQRSRE